MKKILTFTIAAFLLALPLSAGAALFTLSTFDDGTPAEVILDLTVDTSGTIKFIVTVDPTNTGNIGDIRAIYFDVSDAFSSGIESFVIIGDAFNTFAVRLTSVGPAGSDRDGSSKLNGGAPVPEPATMLLLGAGLIGLAGFGRKKILKKK